jgi:glucokinase
MTPARVLAVDVGGTKLAAAVVAADGTMPARAEVGTPTSADPTVVAGAVRRLVDDVLAAAAARGVSERLLGLGIGSAGPVDPVAGTVSPVNIPAWRRFPLVETLRPVLPGRPTVLAGDGNCMALGEYWRGTAGGSALLGMVVSTGVGGGLVVDGRVYLGGTGNAGHIGHLVVDLDGERCGCGSRGCVETMASGPSMVRWAVAHGWSTMDGVPRDARALARDAQRGHPAAREAFQRAANALAAAIVSAAALVDLDEVVIGGGVAQAGDVLFGPLLAALPDLAGFEFVRRVRVSRSALGGDAGLLGAAALALDRAGLKIAPARSGTPARP